MRVLGAVSLVALLSGCAFSRQVERFGVEYNAALAGMNNEQTLLNILRARDGMPTHFTSVSQFRGNLALTANASLNGQFRGEGLTESILSSFSNTNTSTTTTTTSTTAPGAAPSTSIVASTVTTPVTGGSTTSGVAEGVDLYTPQVSGQIVSGSAFDVAVFDTQKFYQGITNAIPFSTIQTLLNRGMDERVVAALTIVRVDFRLDETVANRVRGETILSFVNEPGDRGKVREFERFLDCYELGSATLPGEATNLVAISRFTRGSDGRPIPLALDEITAIDGERFGLSEGGIGDDAANDGSVFLTRLTGDRQVARLSQRSLAHCTSFGTVIRSFTLPGGETLRAVVPTAPPARPVYLGRSYALLYAGGRVRLVKVRMGITFRSPEGLFTYIGAYLRTPGTDRINIDGRPLFAIAERRDRNALAQANYRGRPYSLMGDDAPGIRNAQIFTLMQQLVNLQKEATERPNAIPVRAIP